MRGARRGAHALGGGRRMATIDYENKAGIALAEYKLGLVSPALNGTFPDPTMAAYFRRIASEPLGAP